MSWISDLFKSIKRLLLGESEAEKYIQRWVSKDGRIEILSKVRADRGAIATFVLRNKTDSLGEVVVYVDLITELVKGIKERKIAQGASFRYKPYEAELVSSLKSRLSHRITVFHVYPMVGAATKEQRYTRLRYIIDVDWSGDSYDRAFNIAQALAMSFLEINLPQHFGDWSKYVLDPYATDWVFLADYNAKRFYGENYKARPVLHYKSLVR